MPGSPHAGMGGAGTARPPSWRRRHEERDRGFLYEFGAEIDSNAVEVYVSRLRKKLGREFVSTIRGLGYKAGAEIGASFDSLAPRRRSFGDHGVLWIEAAGLAGTVMYAQINEAFDQSLRQGALRLPLAVHEIGEGDKYGLDRVRGSDRDRDEAYFTYYLIDQHGAMVLRTDDAPDISPPVLVSAGFSDVDGKRLFSKTDPRSGFSIVLVERTEHRRAALRQRWLQSCGRSPG